MDDAPPYERNDSSGSPPRTMDEALTRARHHARLAAREGVHAARSIIDAASLAAGGRPASRHAVFSGLIRTIDDVAGALDGGSMTSPIFDTLHDALDAEVRRWEQRAQVDPDARAVLRAFLGVREILWELGIRRPSAAARDDAGAARTRGRTQPSRANPSTNPSHRPGPVSSGLTASSPVDTARPASPREDADAARHLGAAAARPDPPTREVRPPQREGRRVQRIELDP